MKAARLLLDKGEWPTEPLDKQGLRDLGKAVVKLVMKRLADFAKRDEKSEALLMGFIRALKLVAAHDTKVATAMLAFVVSNSLTWLTETLRDLVHTKRVDGHEAVKSLASSPAALAEASKLIE